MVDYFPTSFSSNATQIFSSPSEPGNNVKLILIPSRTYAQEVVQTSLEVVVDPHAPLDLSCKTPSGHDLLRRSSSSSSASSNDSGFQSCDLTAAGNGTGGEDVFVVVEKRLKRREQNKAAAQAYRQRKKSFSELVESEYDLLLKQNADLLGRKSKLESQISRMRHLLELVVQNSKKRQEEEERRQLAAADQLLAIKTDESDVVSNDVNGGDDDNYFSDTGKSCAGPSGVSGRSRQYSWPSDGSTCPPGSGKNRKKEQNRIASQRFRERRRRLMSQFQEEAEFYQCSNVRLRKRCEDLQAKIQLIKNFLQRKQVALPVFSTEQQQL